MSELLRLERVADIGTTCTFGRLYDVLEGKLVCVTLELPWKGNARNVSRIPSGCYTLEPYVSNRFGKCFRIPNDETEPQRTEIRLHAGNTAADTRGCILPGTEYGHTYVLHSKDALINLLRRYPKGAILHIEDPRT